MSPIVKIDADNLYAVQWGDSDKLQVGEFVLAIGNPYGLSHTSYDGDNQRGRKGECRHR